MTADGFSVDTYGGAARMGMPRMSVSVCGVHASVYENSIFFSLIRCLTPSSETVSWLLHFAGETILIVTVFYVCIISEMVISHKSCDDMEWTSAKRRRKTQNEEIAIGLCRSDGKENA